MKVEATAARTRHTITVTDGTEIFFKDWGAGQPIVFSHGSPLNSDAWEDQISRRSSRNSICTTPSTSPTRPAPVRWRGTSAARAPHAWRRLYWLAP